MGTANAQSVQSRRSPFAAAVGVDITVTATSAVYAMGRYNRVRVTVPSGRGVRMVSGDLTAQATGTTGALLTGQTAGHIFSVPAGGFFALVRDSAEVSDVAAVNVALGD